MGCTTVLGIDGDYVIAEGGSGGGGTGGRPSSSGSGGMTPPTQADASPDGTATVGRGGSGGTGGVPPVGGTGGLSEEAGLNPGCGPCQPNEKCCGGVCTPPAPIVGCSLNGCDPCLPQSMGAVPVCVLGACTEECALGYVEMAGGCVPSGAGGSGGGGNPVCDPRQCSCFLVPTGVIPCCTDFDRCGCTFAPGAYCFGTGP